jgi:hypothetical protein
MILMMTMPQRRPRILSDEIDLDRAESRHVDRILDHARRRLVAYLGDLEAAAIDVDGVVSPLLLVIASR